MRVTLFLVPFLKLSQALLIPGGVTTQDTSIPGALPIWSLVLTTTSCTNATTPQTVLVQMAPDTTGVYLHPPTWGTVNVAMIQDPQVTSISQIQMLSMTLIQGQEAWQMCGLQISINDAAVYADTNQVTLEPDTAYVLDLATLQQNSLWVESNAICNPPAQFSTMDIQNLVIGKIGNYIVTTNNTNNANNNPSTLDWQSGIETSAVLVALNGTTQVASLLQYQTIPFTLFFNVAVGCGGNQLTIVIDNLYNVYNQGSDVSSDTQATINAILSPLATTTSLTASFCPSITVNADGSISFGWPFGVGSMGALCWST